MTELGYLGKYKEGPKASKAIRLLSMVMLSK
jgi:hypothetical protein